MNERTLPVCESGYTIVCQEAGCDAKAGFKVAAEWSDSGHQELKTYALGCEAHLEQLYKSARERCGQYQLAEGEQLAAPGIYTFPTGGPVHPLQRRRDLEERFGG